MRKRRVIGLASSSALFIAALVGVCQARTLAQGAQFLIVYLEHVLVAAHVHLYYRSTTTQDAKHAPADSHAK